MQVFKVLHQIGTVKHATTQVARHGGHPRPTGDTAGVTHGVFVAPTRPVRQRRTRNDDGAKKFRSGGRRHHQLPARLAVANYHGLALSLWVKRNNFF